LVVSEKGKNLLMKKRQQRQQRRGKKVVAPQTVTRAVTHIRLIETNTGKLAALDQLASVYLALCQEYVTLFCTDERPNAYRATVFETLLSERWQRVAIQQAAGIAKSWRTNREEAYLGYLEEPASYKEQEAEGTLDEKAKEPEWHEWNVPILHQTCIQANVNVVKLEPSEDSKFDYWLRISTLEFRKQLFVPVKLAEYHRKILEGKIINTSVQLNKRENGWWLTLSYDEIITVKTALDAQVIGIDVGITNFVTTSDGKHYGSFDLKLRERHQRDREKRRRKAKLRKCLERKGVKTLPSTSSKSGQRLARHIRQEINRAVNECFTEHPEAHFAYEHLSVASMKFKARAMNAYLYASNLGHIPAQIEWNATKREMQATRVNCAYTSQQCSVCYYVDRKNRPDQQTFCCRVCHYHAHADVNAAMNIEKRVGDTELQECKSRKQIKSLLMQRHVVWKQLQGWP
jgi:hypothetical protein